MNNLDQAIDIVARIDGCVRVQDALKRAFRNDALEGGWKAALDHPLYLQAGAEIEDLYDQLKVLV